MAEYVVVNKDQLEADLTIVADAIRAKGGTTEKLELPLGMKQAVESIETGIIPTGTIEITENGTHDVTNYASANVNVASGGSDNFVGIKYSDFETDGYHLPRVADARSIPIPKEDMLDKNDNFTAYWFSSSNTNGNGGYTVKLTDIYMPDNLIRLGMNTFNACASLKNLHGDFSKVAIINTQCFSNCEALTKFPYFPELRTYIGTNAFRNCTSLTEVKLYVICTTIIATAFSGCTNITDIYVPWSEGEVANAPWGAINATIHYNTIYDENHNPIIQEV